MHKLSDEKKQLLFCSVDSQSPNKCSRNLLRAIVRNDDDVKNRLSGLKREVLKVFNFHISFFSSHFPPLQF